MKERMIKTMSMLKKIASLFFEETQEDIIVEDELEDIKIREKVHETEQFKKAIIKPEVEEAKNEKEVLKKTASARLQSQKKQSTQITPVEAIDKQTEKKFISIDLESKYPKTERKKRDFGISTKDDKGTNYAAVISPIFGSNNADEEEVEQEHHVLTMAKWPNPLGTVISPYYGVSELAEFEAQAHEAMEEKGRIRRLAKANNQKNVTEMQPKPTSSKKKSMSLIDEDESNIIGIFEEEEEDINCISLDDLIMENENEESEDDVMQISLFGGSTKIKESEKANEK